jgi:pyruvate,water dikinase
MAPGSASGFQAVGQPLDFEVRRINTYRYASSEPVVPPDQMQEAARRGDEMLDTILRQFPARWEQEWLPELIGYHNQWDSFDRAGATTDQLLQHFEWTLVTFQRLWEIHFEAAPGFIGGPSMFLELYRDLFGTSQALDAYKLLQGFENTTLQAGNDLWDLAQSEKSEDVRRIVIERPTSEVLAVLAMSEEGVAFLARLDDYLELWGARSNMLEEYAAPSWIEDPSTVIENLKNYMAHSAVDPRLRWNELVTERKRLVAETRAELATYPEPVRQRFEELLVAGQEGQRLQEDHNWWIDQRGTHTVRMVLLEIGRRFAEAGVIETRDDVFCLYGDELRRSLGSQVSGDFRRAVSERRAEMDHWRTVKPPGSVGTESGKTFANAMTRAMGRFFGGSNPERNPDRPGVVTGAAGSPGSAIGVARVIVRLTDAGRLKRGEILVTKTTNPPWTPLFATAGGIVTDTGGPLSHCAIVAREYGIPAVVGTGTATEIIVDGQMIEVDGDSGEVRLISDDQSPKRG